MTWLYTQDHVTTQLTKVSGEYFTRQKFSKKQHSPIKRFLPNKNLKIMLYGSMILLKRIYFNQLMNCFELTALTFYLLYLFHPVFSEHLIVSYNYLSYYYVVFMSPLVDPLIMHLINSMRKSKFNYCIARFVLEILQKNKQKLSNM